jgi:hypothetical protein
VRVLSSVSNICSLIASGSVYCGRGFDKLVFIDEETQVATVSGLSCCNSDDGKLMLFVIY